MRVSTGKLVVHMPLPEEEGTRRIRGRTAAGTEKGTAIRGRIGASRLDSLHWRNKAIEAHPPVLSERRGEA
jgi:hypothetical protein